MDGKKADYKKLITEAIKLEGSISDIYSRFYPYSFGNQMLLLVQGVHEPVATYKNWQKLGRQVKKGSKAKAILRPVTIRRDDEDEEEQFTFFKLVNCLFTYSDTDGDELPKPVSTSKWDAEKAREALGVALVDYEELIANSQGYSFKKNIAINPVAEYPLKTMAHELAHVILGHTGEGEGVHADGKELERDIKEFQAEATAYIIMNEAGAVDGTDWDRSGSRAYIQGWLGGKEVEDKHIRQVFKAVDTILKAGR